MQHSCYSSTWLCAVRQCQSPWGATKTCSCSRVCRKWRQKLRIWRWRSNCARPPYFYFIILIHRDQLWDLSCATWLGWRVICFNFLKKSVLDKQLTLSCTMFIFGIFCILIYTVVISICYFYLCPVCVSLWSAGYPYSSSLHGTRLQCIVLCSSFCLFDRGGTHQTLIQYYWDFLRYW